MQYYSDPSRENETYALPDVEVFYADNLTCEECNGNGELDSFDETGDTTDETAEPCDACDGTGHKPAGFYFWYCFPGCMPEGEPWGPYDTETEAVDAMREDAS
jgi:hypothetical protein